MSSVEDRVWRDPEVIAWRALGYRTPTSIVRDLTGKSWETRVEICEALQSQLYADWESPS
jgi:hypothetical protein